MTLHEFIEESIRRSAARDYHPTAFMRMWYPDRDPEVIEKLVKSGEPKSGYVRMVEIGLKDWTLEAAVLAYPHQFSKEAAAYAKARLDGILDA